MGQLSPQLLRSGGGGIITFDNGSACVLVLLCGNSPRYDDDYNGNSSNFGF